MSDGSREEGPVGRRRRSDARIAGGILAGNVLPGYEIGGRLLLLSDGVLGRGTGGGETFGMQGVRAAIAGAQDAPAASTVIALQDAIMAASTDPLEDDATIVVFAPTSPA
jgi:hypothetical protein